MNNRVIVIGLIVLAIIAGVIYWRRASKTETPTVPENTASAEQNLEDKFKIQLPDDASKTELKAVGGGNGSGIFSSKFESSKLTGSVLADLPAPNAGEYYEVWVEKGEKGSADYKITSIGRLTSAKGGYMLNLNSASDYTTNDKVLITLETKVDNTPEKTVLEGSF